MIADYNSEVVRWQKAKRPKNVDGFLNFDKICEMDGPELKEANSRAGTLVCRSHIRNSRFTVHSPPSISTVLKASFESARHF